MCTRRLSYVLEYCIIVCFEIVSKYEGSAGVHYSSALTHLLVYAGRDTMKNI